MGNWGARAGAASAPLARGSSPTIAGPRGRSDPISSRVPRRYIPGRRDSRASLCSPTASALCQAYATRGSPPNLGRYGRRVRPTRNEARRHLWN